MVIVGVGVFGKTRTKEGPAVLLGRAVPGGPGGGGSGVVRVEA
jgi:hypothetical protein